SGLGVDEARLENLDLGERLLVRALKLVERVLSPEQTALGSLGVLLEALRVLPAAGLVVDRVRRAAVRRASGEEDLDGKDGDGGIVLDESGEVERPGSVLVVAAELPRLESSDGTLEQGMAGSGSYDCIRDSTRVEQSDEERGVGHQRVDRPQALDVGVDVDASVPAEQFEPEHVRPL